jgi:peptide/nickel transport system substrate-binding protein
MVSIPKRAVVAGVAAVAMIVTACSSSKKTGGGTGSASASSPSSTQRGGTLYYLTSRNTEHWDPQRTYIGRDLATATRLFYRTLTQLTSDNKLVPGLATDTGKASDGNKTWTFTLKQGPKWQDGSPVTCEDIKYGVSRTFAVNVITGGPNYQIQFLNIPTKPDGSSVYSGPYTKKNQAAYDKAVVCNGNTITFHLRKPVGDFNYAVSGALMAFAPFKQSHDKAAQSNYQVFSDGPYMIQGTWQEGHGGTFVRNPNYDPFTDTPGVRKALPDKIVFQEGADRGDDLRSAAEGRGSGQVRDHRPVCAARLPGAGRAAEEPHDQPAESVHRLSDTELQDDDQAAGAPGARGGHRQNRLHHSVRRPGNVRAHEQRHPAVGGRL